VLVEEEGGLRAYLGAYTISSFGRVAKKGGNILLHILCFKRKNHKLLLLLLFRKY
jgi:hypothetical protein